MDIPAIITAAERLAALGRYPAANAILAKIPADELPIRIGLLRGKIFIQQGQFAAAIAQWRVLQSIEPHNPEIQQALQLAIIMQDQPARSILLRANLHLILQYIIILLLGGIIILQALYSPPNQNFMQFHAQVSREANERLEKILGYFHESQEQRLLALEQSLKGLNEHPATSYREIIDRLSALEQAIALERESIRALGARQEERITALGMIVGEIGAHLSPAPPAPVEK